MFVRNRSTHQHHLPTHEGMFEILVSFPLGLVVWLVLLNEPGVTYLMYNGIFIILGIGCDDIFVFIDAFRQSELEPPEISGSLETRFGKYAIPRLPQLARI